MHHQQRVTKYLRFRLESMTPPIRWVNMLEQVLDGGQNLLEVVDKLTAETAAQEAALEAEKAAEAAAQHRIAKLEQANLHIEEQYNSVQVRKCYEFCMSLISDFSPASDLQLQFEVSAMLMAGGD